MRRLAEGRRMSAKTVVGTGASRGIGRGCALLAAENG
jgi:NAD(P)-dependent dehydrogenase (short-subunit alcohol dehydrogenase family)